MTLKNNALETVLSYRIAGAEVYRGIVVAVNETTDEAVLLCDDGKVQHSLLSVLTPA